MRFQRLAALLGVAVFGACAVAQPSGDVKDYLRVSESEDGSHVRLDVAIHSLTKEKAPTVFLVGVTHVGDQSYYEELQKFLDEQDVVLFEGVKPEGSGAAEGEGSVDASNIRVTEARLRLLGVLVERYRAEHKALPESLDQALDGLHGTMARLGKAARIDRWGHEVSYVRKPVIAEETPKFDLVSLGADGKEGGDGPNADLKLSAQPVLTKKEVAGGGEGIQVRLAKALHLEFQLAAVDYNRPKWRNSDITIDKLEERFKQEGMDPESLFSMLDGSSLMSRFVGVLLGFVEKNEQLGMQVKLMLVEMLSNGDAAMGAAAGAGMGKFIEILIKDRNAIALADLKAITEKEPTVKSVAIFYGAGHMPELEKSLAEIGYTPATQRWLTAVDLDVSKYPGGVQAAKQARAMMKQMMAAQMPKPASKEDKKDN